MSIKYNFEVVDSILRVKAIGKDDSLDEVLNYGKSIIDAVNKYGVHYVLSDETELEYTISTFETFQSAKYISEQAPKLGKIAIVISPKNAKDASFFENVGVNRGLNIRFFLSNRDAEVWLLDNSNEK